MATSSAYVRAAKKTAACLRSLAGFSENPSSSSTVLLFAAHCVTGCCCSMLSGGLHDRYCCMLLIVLLVVVVQCYLEDYMTDTVVCRSLCYWLLFNVIWRTT